MAKSRRELGVDPYGGPAGGWGSLKSVAEIVRREKLSPVNAALMHKQNKPDGFMCVSCAWGKPEHPHLE